MDSPEDDHPIRLQSLPEGGGILSLTEGGDGRGHAGADNGRGGGHRRSLHTPARAGNGQAVPLPGGIDKKEVQHHIGQVGGGIEQKRCLGVAHTPQHRREDNQQGVEGHGGAVDADVVDGVGEHLRLGPQPPGKIAPQHFIEPAGRKAADQRRQKGLPDDLPHPLGVVCPHSVGDLDRVTHAHSGQNTVEQPDGRAVHRHGGGTHRAQHPYHGGVHIAHHGAQHLLDDGRPGQTPQDTQPLLLSCQHRHGITLLSSRNGEHTPLWLSRRPG